MVVSHEHKYVYIAIPKTACQAVSQWLVEKHGGEYVRPCTHRWWPPEGCEQYLVFTVVRNPYERCFSWWWYGCREPNRREANAEIWGMSFPEFMRERIGRKDNAPIDPETGRPNTAMTQARFFELSGASRFVRYEALEGLSDLQFVEVFNGLPRRNVTVTKPKQAFQAYFEGDSQAEDLVWEYCREDFEAFGYERARTQ